MGKRVGQYLQQLREAQGLSLRELGTRAGLSAAHLSLVEHGRREASVPVLYSIVAPLNGNFITALRLLALDVGIPPDAVEVQADCKLEIPR